MMGMITCKMQQNKVECQQNFSLSLTKCTKQTMKRRGGKRQNSHQNRQKEEISLKVMTKKTNMDVHHQLHSMIDKPKK
jgi:hypothetical protein